MLRLMKADLYRLLKGKTIYILIGIIILLSLISTIMMQSGGIGMSVGETYLGSQNNEFVEKLSQAESLSETRKLMKQEGAYPLDKDIIGHNINLYYFFIVIVVSVIAIDFSNRSIKNTLSSAVSRKTYYFSKLCLVLGIVTFLIVFNNYFSYFLNILINGKAFSSPLSEIFKATVVQLPLLYGISSFLVGLAFVLKKTSSFNTISIPFIMMLQFIVTSVINLLKIKSEWFYNYEIEMALAKLVNNPTTQYVANCAILGITYIIVFNLIGYYAFKKTEIK